jgi:hypothetical protein
MFVHYIVPSELVDPPMPTKANLWLYLLFLYTLQDAGFVD